MPQDRHRDARVYVERGQERGAELSHHGPDQGIGVPVNRANVVIGILFQASRADDGLRQAWRRRIWKAVAMTLSLLLTRE